LKRRHDAEKVWQQGKLQTTFVELRNLVMTELNHVSRAKNSLEEIHSFLSLAFIDHRHQSVIDHHAAPQ